MLYSVYVDRTRHGPVGLVECRGGWSNVQPNTLGGFNSMDIDGGVKQVVQAPGVGYSAKSDEDVKTCQPGTSGGINDYSAEGRNGYVAPRPAGKGITVYVFEM